VVVIQHQDHLAVTGLSGQLVDQDRHQPLKRPQRRRAEQRPHPLGQSWPGPIQRGDRVAPEPGRVVVPGIQAKPRHRPPPAAGPDGQQRRLAKPRRSANQHQSPRQPRADRLHQARARRKIRPPSGHVQLGGQQDILPGHGNPARGCRGRLSHRRPTIQPASDPPASGGRGHSKRLPPIPARVAATRPSAPSCPAGAAQDSTCLRTFG
jgi:hypothetical protein